MNATLPICYFCQHPVDLDTDDYERIDTLDTLAQGKPKAYVHALCAAEAEADYIEDRRIESWFEWSDIQDEIMEDES